MKDYTRCPHCKRPYTEDEFRIRREKKSAALTAAREKMIARGNHIGRPKTRNDSKIIELRKQGYSMREIAKFIGCSTHTVHISIKTNMKSGKVEHKSLISENNKKDQT